MVLDGVVGEFQDVGDFADGVAQDELVQDFGFALGEPADDAAGGGEGLFGAGGEDAEDGVAECGVMGGVGVAGEDDVEIQPEVA